MPLPEETTAAADVAALTVRRVMTLSFRTAFVSHFSKTRLIFVLLHVKMIDVTFLKKTCCYGVSILP